MGGENQKSASFRAFVRGSPEEAVEKTQEKATRRDVFLLASVVPLAFSAVPAKRRLCGKRMGRGLCRCACFLWGGVESMRPPTRTATVARMRRGGGEDKTKRGRRPSRGGRPGRMECRGNAWKGVRLDMSERGRPTTHALQDIHGTGRNLMRGPRFFLGPRCAPLPEREGAAVGKEGAEGGAGQEISRPFQGPHAGGAASSAPIRLGHQECRAQLFVYFRGGFWHHRDR